MKRLGISLLFLISLSYSGEVFFYNVKNQSFSVKLDKDVKPALEFGYTLPWGEKYFSRIRFIQSRYTETDKLVGFPESRRSATYDQIAVSFFPVGLDFGNLEGSLGLSYLRLDRLEFGYVHFPPDLGNQWVSFENEVKFNFYRVSLSLEYGKDINPLQIFLYSHFYPYSKGNLDQRTFFKPIVGEEGRNETDVTSKFSYEAGLAVTLKGGWVSLSAFYEREILNLEYNLKVLTRTDSGFSFDTEGVESEEQTDKYGAILSLHFLKKNPYVGYYVEKIKTIDKKDDSESSSETKYFVFGFLF